MERISFFHIVDKCWYWKLAVFTAIKCYIVFRLKWSVAILLQFVIAVWALIVGIA